MKEIIELLIKREKSIATMESCTGGALVSAITDIPGASNVLPGSIITYSNKEKIKYGIKEATINKYSVYSKEVAMEMAERITFLMNTTYGIGITGQIGCLDPKNEGILNKIYISIYNTIESSYNNFSLEIDPKLSRRGNKAIIIQKVIEVLLGILEKSSK